MMKRTTQIVMLGSLLALGACSSGGGGEEPSAAPAATGVGERGVALEIRNNLLRPRVALTIRIRAPGRTVTTLGTVQADQTRTFIIDSSNLASGWVIIASRQGEELMVSRRLTATCCAMVRWDLNADRLSTEEVPGQ